ncbi:MAG: outer membrane protein OmpA-like peptidoglycan-associated protein, partial [Saprospiraceae bacterium]
CAILIGLCSPYSFAQSIKKMRSDADALFYNKKFKEALTKYYNVQYSKPDDMEIRLKIGACSYFVNKSDQAKKYLLFILENDKKPDPNTYFYLGRTYHADLNFKEAIKNYKLYLKKIKDDNENRAWVKDEIRRCASGMRLTAKDQIAIVENLGENVNSEGDDFAPVLSPNFDDKIYFSSSRLGNQGGMRNDDGFKDKKFGEFKSDMFSTQIVNGEWTATTPMNPLLNSSRNDLVLGFDEAGAILYYFKGPSLFSGEVLVDTFNPINGKPLLPDHFVSPMKTESGDSDPQFYKDSVLVFSSKREGGYGGKDLYITKFMNGAWESAKNLGPVINSKYDEITPFLSTDGRTLYFSSNNTTGMGGFDVYESSFEDDGERWAVVENLGLPINSAGNDTHFKLSADGYKGYFCSSRIESYGKRDIYVSYFKTPRREQLATSTPLVFSDVRAYKTRKQSGVSVAMQTPNSGEGTTTTISAPQFSEEEITSYEFSPLFYDKEGQVLNYKNTNELNKLARLLIRYPQLKLILTSNSEGGTPVNFDLYFSIKKAEDAAAYLIKNGVNSKSITLKGCGVNYPIAKLETESGFNPQALKLNRRIDVDILNTTGLPIRVKVNPPMVNNRIKSDLASNYKTAIQGLSYKVQIAAIKQMYSGDIMEKYPDVMVESNGASQYYKYTLGLYQTFSSADQMRKELLRQGVTDSFIVPYVNGLRVNHDDSKIYAAAYPDLLDFINNSE